MGEADGHDARATDVLDLETWVVATFDVAVFVLVAVLLGHASGVLAGVLRGAGTLPGVLAFAYLWALGVLAIGWALPAEGLHGPNGLDLRSLATRGVVAGAFVGAGFVAGPLVLFAAAGFLGEGGDPLPFLAIVVVGGALAGVVGAVVGFAAVVLDVALYRAADLLVAREAGPAD